LALAVLSVLRQLHGMNAVDPVRKMRAMTVESRVLRRGVLGDRIDGRSREGRFLTQIERELTAQVGGAPSATQRLLIRRLARNMLRLELVDEKMTSGKELSAHDARTFSALSNQVRLISRELGLRAAAAKAKAPDLAEILAEHGNGAR
jgi:hypothetical protein